MNSLQIIFSKKDQTTISFLFEGIMCKSNVTRPSNKALRLTSIYLNSPIADEEPLLKWRLVHTKPMNRVKLLLD